jgi:hypothetical protein
LATTSPRAELADAKDHRDNTLPRLVEVDARIVSAQDRLDHERDRIAREQEAARSSRQTAQQGASRVLKFGEGGISWHRKSLDHVSWPAPQPRGPD